MFQIFPQLQRLWRAWHRFMTGFITRLALSLVYLFGIGGTSMVARLFGKKFLQAKFEKSSWQPITGSNKLEKMF